MDNLILHPVAYPPVGRLLKARRDVLGYSLAEASDHAQMSEKTLRLIESESFHDLPEPVFARGYLRRYSQSLQLNPSEIAALFDAWILCHQAQQNKSTNLQSQTPKAIRQPSRKLQISQATKGIWLPISNLHHAFFASLNSRSGQALVVSACIGLFSFFLSHNSESQVVKTAAHQSTQLASDAPVKSHRLVQVQSAPPANVAKAQKVVHNKPTVSRKSTSGSQDQLVATETTHVTVFDRNGLIIFSGLVRAEKPVTLRGQEPFDVRPAKIGTVTLITQQIAARKSVEFANL